jgi:hypothetical protein
MSFSLIRDIVLPGFALCFALAQPSVAAAPLTARQVSEQASAASSSDQFIERRTDGTVRMNAPMQAMEAIIGPDGVRMSSVGMGGSEAFSWRLSGMGRGEQIDPVAFGSVAVAGDVVSLRHPHLIPRRYPAACPRPAGTD